MTLPPYNPDATCPKCGGGKAAVKFRANIMAEVAEYTRREREYDNGRKPTGWWVFRVPPPPNHYQRDWLSMARVWLDQHPPPYTEHIRRTCTCCGYAWPEAPMDAEPGVNDMAARQLAEFAHDLASKQEPLPDDMQRVWDENRDKLYADSEAPMDKESA